MRTEMNYEVCYVVTKVYSDKKLAERECLAAARRQLDRLEEQGKHQSGAICLRGGPAQSEWGACPNESQLCGWPTISAFED